MVQEYEKLLSDFVYLSEPLAAAARLGLCSCSHSKGKHDQWLLLAITAKRYNQKHLSAIEPTAQLSHLLYNAKTLELIYFLLSKLLGHEEDDTVFVNQEDAAIIYGIRDEMLKDFSVTPELPKLATHASMSQSKLKQLFSQIFGNSIYKYFQAERMDEAAFLLNHFTVSETGFKVGFTNLSHFTRLLEKHHGIKPKKYKYSFRYNNKIKKK